MVNREGHRDLAPKVFRRTFLPFNVAGSGQVGQGFWGDRSPEYGLYGERAFACPMERHSPQQQTD